MLVVIGAAVIAAVTAVLAAMSRAAVERAHAQRVADEVALLAAQHGPGAARRLAAAEGAALDRLSWGPAGVTVRVRLPTYRALLPKLAGGPVPVTPEASAAAAPGVAAVPGGLGIPGWVPQAYRAPMLAAARAERLPVAVLAAQIARESGFRPGAVSPAGARGLAQFLPGTWAGAWNPWRRSSPFDPVSAIRAQARYLARLLALFHGDLVRALAAYNAGVGRARRTPASWPAETRAYVPAVLALARGETAPPGAFGLAQLVG